MSVNSLSSSLSAFKFATLVVLDTTNGAVPVDTVLVTLFTLISFVVVAPLVVTESNVSVSVTLAVSCPLLTLIPVPAIAVKKSATVSFLLLLLSFASINAMLSFCVSNTPADVYSN